MNWLMDKFERAKAWSVQIPEWARPVWVKHKTRQNEKALRELEKLCPKCQERIKAKAQTLGTRKSYDIDTVFHLDCWESMTKEEQKSWL